jgi:hypothetical protein
MKGGKWAKYQHDSAMSTCEICYTLLFALGDVVEFGGIEAGELATRSPQSNRLAMHGS